MSFFFHFLCFYLFIFFPLPSLFPFLDRKERGCLTFWKKTNGGGNFIYTLFELLPVFT